MLNGDFVWRSKPDAYVHLKSHEAELFDNCEQRIEKEFRQAQRKSPKEILYGKVEVAEFNWREHKVRWEKYLNIDWDNLKRQSATSEEDQESDLDDVDTQSAAFNREQVRELPPEEARQLLVARHYLRRESAENIFSKKDTLLLPKKAVEDADSELHRGDGEDRRRLWVHLQTDFKKIRSQKSERTDRLGELLAVVVRSWKRWGRRITENVHLRNERNRKAAGDPNKLRAIPANVIFVAVDKWDRVLAFLLPKAIQNAFENGTQVEERLVADTRHMYSHVKEPNAKGNKRHVSEGSTQSKYGHMGTEHYGPWHAKGHPDGPIIETADSYDTSATQRQALLHFLENTGGLMSQVLSFWFGVWDRDLRNEYRHVYEQSPKFARLPPSNPNHKDYGRDVYTLRVVVCNRDTDEHQDQRDWEGGLTGIVHLGRFTGKSGAVLTKALEILKSCRWRDVSNATRSSS